MRRRLIFYCVYALFLYGLFWLGIWGYIKIRYGGTAVFTSGEGNAWEHFYPELTRSGVLRLELTPQDGKFDVLMLGGSVLEDVSGVFEEQLRAQLKKPIRVHRLSTAAHTSRDSYFKYSALRDKHFDLIVVYHGINDVRMNCCPEAEYQDDYTHCDWYRSMKRLTGSDQISLTELLADELKYTIAKGEPDEETLQFGETIKTERAFRNNIKQIVKWAEEKRVPVVLMTFALYLSENYSREKFSSDELDYGAGKYYLPVELWGRAENVVRTIAAHNRVIEDLGRQYDNVIAVDQQNLMPGKGVYFSDPCHFTEAGIEHFVENMIPPIIERLSID